MPNKDTGYLTDNQGNRSSIRLMSVIALVASVIFGYMELKSGASPPYITMLFLISAFCPKALQKFIEDNFQTKKEK